MYQRVGGIAYKADLSNALMLAKHLEQPQNSFKSVHIAGTNGKGSTSHMIASVLQEAGYKVGLYTSPHLKDFRERIKINGKMIPKRNVSEFVAKHRDFFEFNHLSFFEMTVGLAFDYFRNENIDIAIIEVGLGGRLDSTNIITPEVSVITNIGLDHTQFLGSTLAQIASEKAGIIKENIPVVIGESISETEAVFIMIATQHHSSITFAEAENFSEYRTDLLGNYQLKNQRTVLATLHQLKLKSWNISEENIKEGLAGVVKNTGLLGRYQVVKSKPKVICDTAHNKEGLVLVLNQLLTENFENLHIVLGMVSDKDLTAVLPLFPEAASYYFCTPNVPRGMDVSFLKEQAGAFGLNGETYISVMEAYNSALKLASEKDLIFVGGSTFVVAEVV